MNQGGEDTNQADNTTTGSPLVMGVDIEKGLGSNNPRYALVLMSGEEVEEYKGVSVFRLLRMVWKKRPTLIACDNISELARGKKKLARLLSQLPPECVLIQITDPSTSLPKLAKNHGIKMTRLDPLDEARACAKLAMLGVGYKVEVFEPLTKVVVSRARSLGKGGWSQNRYRRKVHSSVRERASQIEERLKERGLSYTTHIQRGFGGYSRVEFTVDAKREDVPVRRMKHGDVRVSVKDVEKASVDYVPLQERRYVIVGIDPGTTVGIAALNLSGVPVEVFSKRGMSQADATRHILSTGTPVLIASDVFPPPRTVQKLASAFQVECVGNQLSVDEKRRLASMYDPANDHERDALAAALSAYKHYAPRIKKAERKAPAFCDIDSIRAAAIRVRSS
ncbi:MAG: DUF460 domain-containing protein [Methermicoccaceae archaeon]